MAHHKRKRPKHQRAGNLVGRKMGKWNRSKPGGWYGNPKSKKSEGEEIDMINESHDNFSDPHPE